VGGSGDGSANPLRLAYTPVLLEGRGALNGGFIGAGGLVDVIRAAIGGHCALVRSATARWHEGAVVVDDVELDERVRRPPVDRQVCIAGGTEGTRVGHRKVSTGIPTFTEDEVTGVRPLDAVATTRSQGIRDLAISITPE